MKFLANVPCCFFFFFSSCLLNETTALSKLISPSVLRAISAVFAFLAVHTRSRARSIRLLFRDGRRGGGFLPPSLAVPGSLRAAGDTDVSNPTRWLILTGSGYACAKVPVCPVNNPPILTHTRRGRAAPRRADAVVVSLSPPRLRLYEQLM